LGKELSASHKQLSSTSRAPKLR